MAGVGAKSNGCMPALGIPDASEILRELPDALGKDFR
jgi:hypothetical protein